MSCSVHTALQLQVTLDVTAARRGQRAVARAAEWLKETNRDGPRWAEIGG